MPTSIPAKSDENRLMSLWRPAERGFTLARRSAEHGFTLARRSAEHGFTPLRRSAEYGFTLVELMVVIAIIGLASAAVILSIPDPRGRLVDDADHFAARVAALRDNAGVAGQPLAVWGSPTDYGFARYADGRWIDSDDKPFRTTPWRTGTRADIAGASPDRVMLRFDSTGLPSEAARVELRRDGERLAVTVDGAGRVKVGG